MPTNTTLHFPWSASTRRSSTAAGGVWTIWFMKATSVGPGQSARKGTADKHRAQRWGMGHRKSENALITLGGIYLPPYRSSARKRLPHLSGCPEALEEHVENVGRRHAGNIFLLSYSTVQYQRDGRQRASERERGENVSYCSILSP